LSCCRPDLPERVVVENIVRIIHVEAVGEIEGFRTKFDDVFFFFPLSIR
jgi:hypothetical protein